MQISIIILNTAEVDECGCMLTNMLTNYVHLQETVPEGVNRTALAQDRI